MEDRYRRDHEGWRDGKLSRSLDTNYEIRANKRQRAMEYLEADQGAGSSPLLEPAHGDRFRETAGTSSASGGGLARACWENALRKIAYDCYVFMHKRRGKAGMGLRQG